MMFATGQIVAGIKAGTFQVLGLRTVGNMAGAQLKMVNPLDFADYAPGELFLPLDALRPLGPTEEMTGSADGNTFTYDESDD
jgi:hypothetical protein